MNELRDHIPDWRPSDAELAARLNAERVPNPEPQATILVPLDALALSALVSNESLTKLETAGLIIPINAAIGAQERETLGRWVQYAAYRQHLTAEEAGALLAKIAETVPDPSWQKELSWAVLTFGREVTAEDVGAVRAQVEYEAAQDRINKRAAELLVKDPKCVELAEKQPNEALHRARMLADNQLNGAAWEVE